MRVLGYPPGWLKDAQNNTLTLFDDNNKCDHNINNNPLIIDDFEDGELGRVHYNKESLIEYPGFNVAVPQGVNDVIIISIFNLIESLFL
jgi:zinc finger CCHC domain-containing protein 8